MRRFEFSEGSSNKFWEVDLDGDTLTVRWGRIGTDGQEKSTPFANEAAAQKEHDKLVAEKTKKGYREVGGGAKAAAPAKGAAATGAWEPTVSGKVKPSELELTELRGRGSWGASLNALRINRRVAGAGGTIFLASTDGKTFRTRTNPGRIFAFEMQDDAWYAGGEGGHFAVSKDRGESWKTIKLPHSGYVFVFFRDSKGTCWLGGDGGVVLKSDHPERGWKKVAVGLKDKVLDIIEADGKLYFCGSGGVASGDGKSFKKSGTFKKDVILTRMTRTPSGALVAIGDAGVIFRSQDGKAWKPVKSGVKGDDLEDLAWVAGSLFVVGGGGAILESSNEGKTFTRRKVEGGPSQKLWAIASWGDGAFIGGDRAHLYKFASPKDAYWRGTSDEFAPKPPKVPEGFAAAQAIPQAERDAAFKKLLAEAEAGVAKLASKKRAPLNDENAELARGIDENPDDDARWEVYADSLQSKGDPRGELAAVQRRLAANPKDKALKKAEAELLKKHAEALIGKLKGFDDVMKLTWKDGFITKARIANTYDRYDSSGGGDEEGDEDSGAPDNPTMPELLGRLLDHPSARFLRELTMGIITFEDNDYDDVIGELAKRSLPSLRALFLGDFESEETELSWSTMGDPTPVFGSAPNLESLTLRSGNMNVGTLAHPKLKKLKIETGGLSKRQFKSILKAALPNLETLTIQFGQDNYGCDIDADDLAPLLEASRFPRLKELGITNSEFVNDAVKLLPKSRLLPQLEVLDLSLGTLGDEGAHLLATYAPAFAHLKKLDLSDNYLSQEGQKLVKNLCAQVEIGAQRDDGGDPNDRYASVGE